MKWVTGRSAGLDAVRFFAALSVLLTHFAARGHAGLPLADWGGNGVSIFFALSGYLLWRPFVTGRPSLRGYLLSRSGRILPGFWLACLVLVPLRGGELARFMVMQPTQPDPLGILWTLQAEVMFYLAVPVLALIRRPLAVPLVLGLASMALELSLTGARGGAIESFLPVRFWAFAPGMILAAWQPRTDWRWLVGGVAMLELGALTLPFWGGQWADVPSTLGAGLLVGWATTANPVGRPVWAAGAAVSYALYLWHVDVIELTNSSWLAIPLVFAVATVSYLAVERPVMRWVGLRLRDHSRLDVAPAPTVSDVPHAGPRDPVLSRERAWRTAE